MIEQGDSGSSWPISSDAILPRISYDEGLPPVYIPLFTPDFDSPNDSCKGMPIPHTPYRVGDPIGGQWIVLGYIGRGAMGVVYLASDQENGELVAVKTIRDDIHSDAGSRERFYDEALSWTNIGRHPHILEAKKVVDVANRIYVSMEYIPASTGMKGSSLRDWLRNCGPLDEKQILCWGIQFCYGMEHACKHGIKCHRDIKPGNILIDQTGKVRIADFGLAVPLDTKDKVGGDCGTPQYMAPEQFDKSGKVDSRSDIYSFGVVLFEMFKGKLPFTADRRHYFCDAGWRDALWRAWQDVHNNESIPDAGEPFGKIIRKCMEKDPADRYQNFPELRDELSRLCPRLNVVIEEPVFMPPSSLELNAKGSQLRALGLFNEAIRYFDQVLDTEPVHISASNGKGFCLLGLERYEEAIHHFDRVLNQNLKDIFGSIGKGLCLNSLKRYDQADQCFDRALYIDPHLPAVWYQKGRNYRDCGFTAKAIDCYYRALNLLISLKRKEEALDIVKESLEHFPLDIRLRQLYGWTLRLRGHVEEGLFESLNVLEDLPADPGIDAETAGILAGTYKRLWAADPERHRDKLQKAYDLYNRAWEHSNRTNTYVGINAATLSLLLGKPKDSRDIAKEIRAAYETRNLATLSAPGSPFSGYWDRVTLAEAELLLGCLGKARRFYLDVMDLYQEKRSYIDSSMDQIDLILPCLGLSINAIHFLQLSLKPPEASRVCFGITGHRKLNSPQTLEEKLREVMARVHQELPNHISSEILSPLAEGADRLAAKVALAEPGALLRVALPLEVDDYLTDFGEQGSESGKEFQSFLNLAEEVFVLPPAKDRNEAYRNVGRYVVDHCDVLIAIWDGKKEKGVGGTAEIVTYARNKGIPLIRINAEYPHKTAFERLEKIKTIDFLKGKFDMYKPKPIDTSHVQLSDDLLELTELLAENAHDNWAQQRMAEGWTYGPERNDANKKNPDMMPYADLPASEKEYDRKMAMETLKAIISLGYRIEKV